MTGIYISEASRQNVRDFIIAVRGVFTELQSQCDPDGIRAFEICQIIFQAADPIASVY